MRSNSSERASVKRTRRRADRGTAAPVIQLERVFSRPAGDTRGDEQGSGSAGELIEPGHGDHDGYRPCDAEPTTLALDPGAKLDRVATDVVRGPEVKSKGKARSHPKTARSPKAEPNRKRADAPSAATLDPTGDEELARLADQIRSSVAGLGGFLMEAWQRKVRLGELLAQGRDRCKGRRGGWTNFLDACRLNERTAREAIQFYRRRAEIEDQHRHDGAALTVTAARKRLAKPRSKSNPERAGKGNPELAEQKGVTSLGDPERSSPGHVEASRSDLVREEDARDLLAPGPRNLIAAIDPERADPDLPFIPVEGPGGQAAALYSVVELTSVLEVLAALVEEVIPSLGSGENESAVVPLRLGASAALAALHRLDAALESLGKQVA